VVGDSSRHVGSTTVQVRKLDDWFATSGLKPGARLVVKADVQGAERQMIEGGRRTFVENVAVFYTEVSIGSLYKDQASMRDLLGVMEELGFIVYQLYRTRSTPSGRALWCDAMWLNTRLVKLDD
jgi:hypothetical protein